MKTTLFITAAAIALFASSCRTFTPIDPMTMKPSARCLPGGGSCTEIPAHSCK